MLRAKVLSCVLIASSTCVVHAQVPAVEAGSPIDLSDLMDPENPTLPLASPNVYLGSAVGVDGDAAIIAGLRPGGDGRAYLYSYDALQGWTRSTRLDEDAGLTTLKGFGFAVSMGGGTAAILQRGIVGPTTAVHLFSSDLGWSLEKTLTTTHWPIANVTSVATWGSTLLLGDEKAADARTGITSGRVGVFVRSPGGWVLQGLLAPSDAAITQRFGASVAIEGDRAVVGAPGVKINGQPRRGACYVFERRAGVWLQTAKLIESTGDAYDDFATKVALSGSTILVASPGRTYGVAKGTVSGFQRTAAGTWAYEGLLPVPVSETSPNAPAPQYFGARLSLSGSLAAIGSAPGRVDTERSYLYQRRGDRWLQITPVDGGRMLSSPGSAVAVSGKHWLVGAGYENTEAGSHSGTTRPYVVSTGLAVFDGPSTASPDLTGDAADVFVDLGDIVVGKKLTRSFTLQNLGTSPLDSLSISSDGVDGEAVILPSATELAIGASVTVTLSVTPPAEGSWQTHLVIDANGDPAVHSVITVVAQGVGLVDSPALVGTLRSQLVWDEAPVEFSADAVGTAPLVYQWYKDNRALTGETQRVLRIRSARAAHAGSYTVKVSNAGGSATSRPATLAVYSLKPDTATRVNDGAAITLNAPVTGPGVQYRWLFNNVPLSEGAPFSGTATPQLKISATTPARAGQYAVVLNPGLSQVSPQRWNITVLQRPQIQNATNFLDALSVARSITGKITTTPAATSFRFTGVPPGITTDARYGTLSGKPTVPGQYTMTVSASNPAGTGAAVSFPITVAGIDARGVGTYRGTIARNDANRGLGGFVQLTTTAAGACTGTLLSGARTIKFTSTLFQNTDATAYLLEVDASQATLTEQYALRLDLATGRLTGTVATSDAPTPTAVATGWITPWSNGFPSAQWTEYCTAAITPKLAVTDVDHVPVGSSYTTLTISIAGAVTWAGRMADGTVSTMSSGLSPTLLMAGIDGVEFPVFFLPANGTGSVLGTGKLNQSDYTKTNYHTITGALDWFKLSEATTSKSRNFKNGIARHDLTLAGASYEAPSPGLPVLNFPFASPNAMLAVTGADFEAAEQATFMEVPFTVAGTANAFFPVPNTLARTLSIDRAHGTFTGTFSLNDPDQLNPAKRIVRKVTFYGALLRSGTGEGFAALPALPDVFATPATTSSTSPIRAAKLSLRPVVAP